MPLRRSGKSCIRNSRASKGLLKLEGTAALQGLLKLEAAAAVNTLLWPTGVHSKAELPIPTCHANRYVRMQHAGITRHVQCSTGDASCDPQDHH